MRKYWIFLAFCVASQRTLPSRFRAQEGFAREISVMYQRSVAVSRTPPLLAAIGGWYETTETAC